MTTAEVAALLQRLGYPATPGSLRLDVHRHLVSPAMAAYRGAGKGERSLWTPMAVRRALYIARLRKRGCAGRVLPLLAFLRDGWGWRSIRRAVAGATRRAAEMDRAYFNRPYTVRRPEDLVENIERRVEEKAARSFWTFVVTSNLWGFPLEESTTLDALGPVLAEAAQAGLLAPEVSVERAMEALGAAERARRELGMSTLQLARRIATLDEEGGQAARAQFRARVHATRVLLHRLPGTEPQMFRSTNPLTLFGAARQEIKNEFRSMRGRPTPSLALALQIASGVIASLSMARVPMPSQ